MEPGQRIGDLLVVRCICGRVFTVQYKRNKHLVGRDISVCTCAFRLAASARMSERNARRTEPPVIHLKLYKVFMSMHSRCRNPKDAAYKNYGGRGIRVCERWASGKVGFLQFLEDMGPQPAGKTTLDRIDNNSNYCPENCRWADRFEQNSNTRKSRMLTKDGRTQTASQWARELGISRCVIAKRMRLKWPEERWLDPVDSRYARYPKK